MEGVDIMAKLNGRIALVTGSSRGVGRATAIALAEAGADVAVNFIEREKDARITLDRITASGRRGITVQANVARKSDVIRMAETVEKELGPVDILVNNAAISQHRSLEEITDADWDETMAVNLKSVFLVTQAVLPGMRARRWGRIINISSAGVWTGGSVGIHYTASKAGVEGLTRAYASRLVKEGITVNALAPALVDTEMLPSGRETLSGIIPLGRLAQPEEMAEGVVFLACHEFMTGQTVNINGGLFFR